MKKSTHTEDMEKEMEKELKQKRSIKASQLKKEKEVNKEEKMIVAEEKSRKIIEEMTENTSTTEACMKLDKESLSDSVPKFKSATQAKTEEKALFTAHRKRMKDQFLKNGLMGLSEHRVLELVLFYAIPQKDVSKLARRLIDTFGSFLRVLRAPYEELKKIKGIGEHSAFLIKLVDELVRFVLARSVDTSAPVKKSDEAYQHLKPYFHGEGREALRMLCLDGDMNYLGVSTVGEGALYSVGLDLRRIVQEVLKFNATHVYLAHNHVEGPIDPSGADWDSTGHVMETLHAIDVCVVDHLIIGKETYASMRKIAQIQKIPLPWPK